MKKNDIINILPGEYMRNILFTILTISLLLLINCDNLTSSNTKQENKIGEWAITALDTVLGMFEDYPKKNILIKHISEIKKDNVLDMDRIYTLPIIVDTTIYEPFVSVCYVDSGGVLVIENNHHYYLDGWYNPLAKKNKQSSQTKIKENEVHISNVYFFTTLKGLHHRTSMSFEIWYYKKYAPNETKKYIIENPDQYCITAEDASMIITLQDICGEEIKPNEIKMTDMKFSLDSEDIYNDYLVIQVDKFYDGDIPVIWRAFKTDAFLTMDYEYNIINHIEGELKDFSNYTFIFKR